MFIQEIWGLSAGSIRNTAAREVMLDPSVPVYFSERAAIEADAQNAQTSWEMLSLLESLLVADNASSHAVAPPKLKVVLQ